MNLVKIGKKAEKEALRFNILKGAKKMSYLHPYDYENYGFKIDVKSFNITIKSFANQYRFRVKRKKHVCDLYLCLGYRDRKLKNAYLLPAYLCPVGEIKISTISTKYEQFRMI